MAFLLGTATAAIAPNYPSRLFAAPRPIARSDAGAKAIRELGFTESGLDALVAEFSRMLEQGLQPGAQVAVFRDGRLVIALAGGATRAGGEPVTHETLYQIRSTTKALATMAIMRLVERGSLRLEDPVAKYWPGFAKHGKGAVTIAHLLSHRAGIPDGPALAAGDLADPKAVAAAVAEMRPVWEPGTANGYHAATIGWVADELARRVAGAPTPVIFADEFVKPLRLANLFIGLPAPEYARMAPMEVEAGVAARQRARAAFSDFLNTPAGIGLPLSWVAGVSNATDLARLMSVLALSGSIDGTSFFKPATQQIFSTPTNSPGSVDLRLQHPVRWGLGFMLGDTPDVFGSGGRPASVGHAGGGAPVAWADPAQRLAVAFLCNRMLGRESWLRYRRIGDAVYGALS